MDKCYMNLGAVKAKEIDGELYISCWNFSKALGEKEREISDLCKEIDNLENQIAELETKLAKKEALINLETAIPITKPSPEIALKIAGFSDEEIRELLRKEEPLPFSDEQYEEDLIEELEDRHQQDCITINQLRTTIDTLVDRYAKLREMRGL